MDGNFKGVSVLLAPTQLLLMGFSFSFPFLNLTFFPSTDISYFFTSQDWFISQIFQEFFSPSFFYFVILVFFGNLLKSLQIILGINTHTKIEK